MYNTSELKTVSPSKIKDTDHIILSWISNINLLLRSHGLEVLAHEHIPLQDRYRTLWNQSHLMGYEEFLARKAERQDNGAAPEEESSTALSELAVEMRKGVSLDAKYFCFVARKVSSCGNADNV